MGRGEKSVNQAAPPKVSRYLRERTLLTPPFVVHCEIRVTDEHRFDLNEVPEYFKLSAVERHRQNPRASGRGGNPVTGIQTRTLASSISRRIHGQVSSVQ